LPDADARTVRGAIELPKLLSVMAKGDPDAEVTGLEATPRSDWPPIAVVHGAFQVMVGAGFAMLTVALWGGLLVLRRTRFESARRFLIAATLVSPLGLVAVEAGWVVTEVGRQPWIIFGIMRVRDAVTPMPGLVISLTAFTAVYAMLGAVVIVLLYRHVLAVARSEP
jgi:cytochrome d ubiquinol oxidase subunit I